MLPLRDPKEIIIFDDNGKELKFLLSKIPAWDSAEINLRYPTHLLAALAVPKISDWTIIEILQDKIMKHVAVDIDGKQMRLETRALIDNHVPDGTSLIQLLAEEVKYNNRFFRNGTILDFFAGAFQAALAKISETLTKSSAPSSPAEKQPSTSSAPSTP